MVCPKFNSHVYTYKGGLYLFLFCNWGSRYMLLLGNVQCSQNIDDGPIKKKGETQCMFPKFTSFFLRLSYVHHLTLRMIIRENML
jgi:hypothetical protein